MQIFLCFSLFFYRLFLMNHVKQQWKVSFWQSETWEDILMRSWQAIAVQWMECGDTHVLIEFRNIWLGMIWAFSTGIDMSYINEKDLKPWKSIAKKQWAIFWQREYLCNGNSLMEMWWSKPYRYFLEPYTRILDLTKDLDVILSEMHEKGRYNIRLAEKRWVTIEWVESTVEHMDIWMWLIAETTDRDGFTHNSRAYYEVFLDQGDITQLAFAYHEGKVIAAGIFVFFGDTAIYYYGASSSDREVRKHMAPYLLQWHALQEGKRRGCQTYDFLGIAAPWSTNDHLAWVTAFKEKFGWEVLELGQKLLIPLSWKYSLFLWVRKLKRILSK